MKNISVRGGSKGSIEQGLVHDGEVYIFIFEMQNVNVRIGFTVRL